jgi:transcriptional regulator with XRE-family HTH domain
MVMIIGLQIRAARVLLGWSQIELCRRSGVSRDTLVKIERGEGNPLMATTEKLVQALEDSGVEMIDRGQISQARGVGVRLKRLDP